MSEWPQRPIRRRRPARAQSMPWVRPASARCGRAAFSAAPKSAGGTTASFLDRVAVRIFLLSLHFGFSAHVPLRRLAADANFSLISFEADCIYAQGLHLALSRARR